MFAQCSVLCEVSYNIIAPFKVSSCIVLYHKNEISVGDWSGIAWSKWMVVSCICGKALASADLRTVHHLCSLLFPDCFIKVKWNISNIQIEGEIIFKPWRFFLRELLSYEVKNGLNLFSLRSSLSLFIMSLISSAATLMSFRPIFVFSWRAAFRKFAFKSTRCKLVLSESHVANYCVAHDLTQFGVFILVTQMRLMKECLTAVMVILCFQGGVSLLGKNCAVSLKWAGQCPGFELSHGIHCWHSLWPV